LMLKGPMGAMEFSQSPGSSCPRHDMEKAYGLHPKTLRFFGGKNVTTYTFL
jgi:hypothetical protein